MIKEESSFRSTRSVRAYSNGPWMNVSMIWPDCCWIEQKDSSLVWWRVPIGFMVKSLCGIAKYQTTFHQYCLELRIYQHPYSEQVPTLKHLTAHTHKPKSMYCQTLYMESGENTPPTYMQWWTNALVSCPISLIHAPQLHGAQRYQIKTISLLNLLWYCFDDDQMLI